LHPENLFQRRTLQFFRNPVLYLIMPSFRSNFARRTEKETQLIKKEL
jgi:hypothetical protein